MKENKVLTPAQFEMIVAALRLYGNDFNWFDRSQTIGEDSWPVFKRSPVGKDHGDKARAALTFLEIK